ncbi:hypothetical protein M3Y97_00959000 [Aphelenchoides bicaudatus]|nr:hypothetical protein M3Y97_00959000 [Aphelenchoides bicaudatus]
MKAFVVGLIAVAFASATTSTNNEGADLAECGSKFADKVQALGGTFLEKDEILDLLQKTFDMYYKQGKTLKEINDYFIANYRNIGLDSDQVDTITEVYLKVQDLLGGAEAIKEYHKKAQDLALDFIKDDQKQVDENIENLKKQKISDAKIELAVCQQVFALTTAQKKIALENKLFALLPSNKVEPVKQQVRKVAKLLSDYSN